MLPRMFFRAGERVVRSDAEQSGRSVGMKIANLEIGHTISLSELLIARSNCWKRATCGARRTFCVQKKNEMGQTRHDIFSACCDLNRDSSLRYGFRVAFARAVDFARG